MENINLSKFKEDHASSYGIKPNGVFKSNLKKASKQINTCTSTFKTLPEKSFDREAEDDEQEIAKFDKEHERQVKHVDPNLALFCKDSAVADFAIELSKSAKMPINTTFLSVLSVFSSITCRAYTVQYQHGGFQPIGLYTCTVQPPATSKSRVLSSAQAPAFLRVKEKRKALVCKIEELENQINELEEKDRKDKKSIIDKQTQVQKELDGLFSFLTDATPEGLDKSLSNSNGYFAIASAEQGAINSLLGISYSKDSAKSSNKDLVLKGYNGEYHNSSRAGRSGFTGNVVGSVTVITQAEVINNLLGASSGSGAVERFILFKEDDLLGKRDHLQQHVTCPFAEHNYSEVMTKIFDKSTNADTEYLASLSFTNNSWVEIAKLRNKYESSIGEDGDNSTNLMRGIIGKIDILIMKLSANLHLATGSDEMTIHNDRLHEAIAIAEAYIKHILSLINSASIGTLTAEEQAVINVIGGSVVEEAKIKSALRRKVLFKAGGSGLVGKVILSLVDKSLIKQIQGKRLKYSKP